MNYEHLDLDAAREALEHAGYYVLDAAQYDELKRRMHVLGEQILRLQQEMANG